MSHVPSRRTRRSLLICALTALVAAPLGAQLDPTLYPAGAVRGAAAVALLGDDLSRVAVDHSLTAAELEQTLLRDETLYVTPEQRLFVVDIPAPERGSESDSSSYSMISDDIPLSQAFLLHTNPGATKTLYMDFTGHHSVSNSWGHNIVFPAYNVTGGAGSFSDAELADIIEWWLRVAEDFAPYDIDVTTEEPPLSALTKNGSGDQTYGMRCVITQATDGFGNGIGGVALLNSFNDSNDNPCFAFNKGDNTGSMTVSHEVGHTFGLQHDGLNGSTYHPGTGSGETSWGPIMGAPFGSNLVQWSNGDYSGATSGQNDTGIITNNSNGIDVWPDDHGDDRFNASPFAAPTGCPDPSPASATGVIETRNDVDAFEFTTTGGEVVISATPFNHGPNVDIWMQLQNSAGAALATVNPGSQVGATLTTTLTAGTYYVLIDGEGLSGSYSDYGSLGQYEVQITEPGASLDPATNLGGGIPGLFGLLPNLAWTGLACGGEDFSLVLSTAGQGKTAFLLLGLNSLGVPFKGGTLWPDFASGSIIPGNTGFLGAIVIQSSWPAGLPSGLEIYVQYWMVDAAGPAGYTASNGLRVVQP